MLWGWLFRGKPVGFRSHFSSCKSCCLWNIRDADGSSHSSSQPWLWQWSRVTGRNVNHKYDFLTGLVFKKFWIFPEAMKTDQLHNARGRQTGCAHWNCSGFISQITAFILLFFLSNFWLILKFLSLKDWGVVSSTVIFAFICHLLWVNLSHIL